MNQPRERERKEGEGEREGRREKEITETIILHVTNFPGPL